MTSPIRSLDDDGPDNDPTAPVPQPGAKPDTAQPADPPEDDGRGEWAGFDTFEAGDPDTAALLAVGPLRLPDDFDE